MEDNLTIDSDDILDRVVSHVFYIGQLASQFSKEPTNYEQHKAFLEIVGRCEIILKDIIEEKQRGVETPLEDEIIH